MKTTKLTFNKAHNLLSCGIGTGIYYSNDLIAYRLKSGNIKKVDSSIYVCDCGCHESHNWSVI